MQAEADAPEPDPPVPGRVHVRRDGGASQKGGLSAAARCLEAILPWVWGETDHTGYDLRIGNDAVDPAAAFCDLLLVWHRPLQSGPARTVLMESLRWLVSPVSGWESDHGLQLAWDILTAIGSPIYDLDAEPASGRPDVCYFRILEPAAAGRVPGSMALVLTLVRCGDGRWRIHGIGDPVSADHVPRPQ